VAAGIGARPYGCGRSRHRAGWHSCANGLQAVSRSHATSSTRNSSSMRRAARKCSSLTTKSPARQESSPSSPLATARASRGARARSHRKGAHQQQPVVSLLRCNFAWGFWFPGVSLCGCGLLVDGVGFGLLVFDSVEVLAVEVGERGAVAGVCEEQVEDGPDH
jgi:hypothetical protein